MFLQLLRKKTIGQTVVGTLYVNGTYYCDTIENASKQIAVGYYPIRITYSPHFDEVLPLLDNVIGRSSIRIHPGNTYRDSSGCILVGEITDNREQITGNREPRLLSSRRAFDPLCESMRVEAGHNEKIWIAVMDASDEKIRQDMEYDRATRNKHGMEGEQNIHIPEEVIELLRLQDKWDVTPTWQSPR